MDGYRGFLGWHVLRIILYISTILSSDNICLMITAPASNIKTIAYMYINKNNHGVLKHLLSLYHIHTFLEGTGSERHGVVGVWREHDSSTRRRRAGSLWHLSIVGRVILHMSPTWRIMPPVFPTFLLLLLTIPHLPAYALPACALPIRRAHTLPNLLYDTDHFLPCLPHLHAPLHCLHATPAHLPDLPATLPGWDGGWDWVGGWAGLGWGLHGTGSVGAPPFAFACLAFCPSHHCPLPYLPATHVPPACPREGPLENRNLLLLILFGVA